MSTLKFSIKGEGINPTKLKSTAREFSFVIDEPPTLGGNDEGPNPVEYLLGSYAGCLNVVINLVAREKNIQVKKLNIDIEGEIDPGKFIGVSPINRAGFQSLDVSIELLTDASDTENIALIKEAKERCPINDNLTNITQVNYKLRTPQLN